jgi:hypothetical protein
MYPYFESNNTSTIFMALSISLHPYLIHLKHFLVSLLTFLVHSDLLAISDCRLVNFYRVLRLCFKLDWLY